METRTGTDDDGLRLTRAAARALDRDALLELGLTGHVLLEHAGRSFAERVQDETRGPLRTLVVCGGGNNGGDGFVVARHLLDAGWPTAVVTTQTLADARGDALLARATAHRAGVPVVTCTFADERGADVAALRGWIDATLGGTCELVVDALLGTGFVGAPRPPLARALAFVDAHAGRATIAAVDLPSGLDADTGVPAHPCVRADWTGTFAARKIGFDAPGASAHLGRVVVLPIGVTRALLERHARRASTDLTSDALARGGGAV